MTDQNRTHSRWPSATIVILPILYVLSFGPAYWLCLETDNYLFQNVARVVYYPVFWLTWNGPEWVQDLLQGYMYRWTPDD